MEASKHKERVDTSSEASTTITSAGCADCAPRLSSVRRSAGSAVSRRDDYGHGYEFSTHLILVKPDARRAWPNFAWPLSIPN